MTRSGYSPLRSVSLVDDVLACLLLTVGGALLGAWQIRPNRKVLRDQRRNCQLKAMSREVRSIDAFTHNFHIHDVQFQVLDVDGEPPLPEPFGWKDTVYLEPRRIYRLIMLFEDYTDPRTPYMFHCQLLRHGGHSH